MTPEGQAEMMSELLEMNLDLSYLTGFVRQRLPAALLQVEFCKFKMALDTNPDLSILEHPLVHVICAAADLSTDSPKLDHSCALSAIVVLSIVLRL